MDNILNLIEGTLILPPFLEQITQELFNAVSNNLFKVCDNTDLISQINNVFNSELGDIREMIEKYDERSITSNKLTKALDNGYLLLSLNTIEELLLKSENYMKAYPSMSVGLFYGDVEYGDFDIKRKLVLSPKKFEIIWDGTDVSILISRDIFDKISSFEFSKLNFFKVGMLYVDNTKGIIEKVNSEIMSKINEEYDSNISFDIEYSEITDTSIKSKKEFSTSGGMRFLGDKQILKLITKSFPSLVETFSSDGNIKKFKSVITHEMTHFYDVVSMANRTNIPLSQGAVKVANQYVVLPNAEVESKHANYISNSSEVQAKARGVFDIMLYFLVEEYKKKDITKKIHESIRNFDEFCNYFLKYGSLNDIDKYALIRYIDIKDNPRIVVPIIFNNVKKNKFIDGRKVWSKFRGYIIDNFLNVLPTIEEKYDEIKKQVKLGVELPKMKKTKDEIFSATTGSTKKVKKANVKDLLSINDRLLNYIYYTMNSYDNLDEFMEQMNDYYQNSDDEGMIFTNTERYTKLNTNVVNYRIIFEGNIKKSPFDYKIDNQSNTVIIYIDDKLNFRVYNMSEKEFKDMYTPTFSKLVSMLAEID